MPCLQTSSGIRAACLYKVLETDYDCCCRINIGHTCTAMFQVITQWKITFTKHILQTDIGLGHTSCMYNYSATLFF